MAHHERFSHDTPDEIWLAAAADKSWLVVTRDQRIRYRANELAAMQLHGCMCSSSRKAV